MQTAVAAPEGQDTVTPKILLISTQGRYSGVRETNFLMYRKDGDDFIVAATARDGHFKPDWYLNLKEEPIVEVEVEGVTFYARASTPVGRERLRLWDQVAAISNLSRQTVPRDTAIVTLTPLC